MDRTTKAAWATKIQELYPETYDEKEFNRIWQEVHETNDNFLELIYKLQPLINSKNPLEMEECMHFAAYFDLFRSMGGDPAYFTSGAGARGNCCTM